MQRYRGMCAVSSDDGPVVLFTDVTIFVALGIFLSGDE